MPEELHDDPGELHSYIQDITDRLENLERIYILPSGCGGGTEGVRATTAEVVIPRTRDCLDILLSEGSLKDIRRDVHGMFFTESWMDFSKKSAIDLDRLTEKMGRSAAEEYLKKLYAKISDFYVIDTGCYDTTPVIEYASKLSGLVEKSVKVIRGGCGILHKIARGAVDDDFVIVPRGQRVPVGFTITVSQAT